MYGAHPDAMCTRCGFVVPPRGVFIARVNPKPQRLLLIRGPSERFHSGISLPHIDDGCDFRDLLSLAFWEYRGSWVKVYNSAE